MNVEYQSLARLSDGRAYAAHWNPGEALDLIQEAINLPASLGLVHEEISFVDHQLVRRRRNLMFREGYLIGRRSDIGYVPLGIYGRHNQRFISVTDPSGKRIPQVSRSDERRLVSAAIVELFDLLILSFWSDNEEAIHGSPSEVAEVIQAYRENLVTALDDGLLGSTSTSNVSRELDALNQMSKLQELLVPVQEQLQPVIALFRSSAILLIRAPNPSDSYSLEYTEMAQSFERWTSALDRTLDVEVELQTTSTGIDVAVTVIPPQDIVLTDIMVRVGSEDEDAEVYSLGSSADSRPTFYLDEIVAGEPQQCSIVVSLQARPTGPVRAVPVALVGASLCWLTGAIFLPGASDADRAIGVAVLLLASLAPAAVARSAPHPLTTRLMFSMRLLSWVVAVVGSCLLLVAVGQSDPTDFRLVLLAGGLSSFGLGVFRGRSSAILARRLRTQGELSRRSEWSEVDVTG